MSRHKGKVRITVLVGDCRFFFFLARIHKTKNRPFSFVLLLSGANIFQAFNEWTKTACSLKSHPAGNVVMVDDEWCGVAVEYMKKKSVGWKTWRCWWQIIIMEGEKTPKKMVVGTILTWRVGFSNSEDIPIICSIANEKAKEWRLVQSDLRKHK